MTTHLRFPDLAPRLLIAAGVLAGLLAAATPAAAAPLAADAPGVGTPWVVTVGDSYISGEAGRWAGSSNSDSARADALGPTAYFDNPGGTGETIDRCHRSRSAPAFIGGGINSLNLACSGARTATSTADRFKPGIDFYADAANSAHKGQARMLQEFATSHNVRMVAISIGGNDFGFSSIVQRCVVDFLGSPTWAKDLCSDDSSVTANFTTTNVAAVRARIAGAFQNVRTAMRSAGYTDAQWTLLVQNYPSPMPDGAGIRYSESGYSRQFTGGCGFWNADATWSNSTALPTINGAVAGAVADSGLTNVRQLDLTHAFDGRRLCERAVGLYEEVGLATWQTPGAVDRTEWVNQIRTVATIGDSPYYVQESLHPNYWGQLAMRACVRQAWNGGAPRGGSCTIAGTGLTNGEPNMSLR